MCHQKTALEILKKNKSVPSWAITLHSAQVKDALEMQARMNSLEADVKDIKENMVSKDDLKAFKNELLPEIRDAAQLDLIKQLVNWKTVFVFLGIMLLFAFGVRGIDFLTTIIEKIF